MIHEVYLDRQRSPELRCRNLAESQKACLCLQRENTIKPPDSQRDNV